MDRQISHPRKFPFLLYSCSQKAKNACFILFFRSEFMRPGIVLTGRHFEVVPQFLSCFRGFCSHWCISLNIHCKRHKWKQLTDPILPLMKENLKRMQWSCEIQSSPRIMECSLFCALAVLMSAAATLYKENYFNFKF